MPSTTNTSQQAETERTRIGPDATTAEPTFTFPDLLDPSSINNLSNTLFQNIPEQSSSSPNLWVIKDAGSNGAGGIWVVGPENVKLFLHQNHGDSNTNKQQSPLLPHHKYVAQRYVWPMVLYGGRKCHVRVYVCMTSDGRALVHRNCFLHVANEPFQVVPNDRESESSSTTTTEEVEPNVYQDSVHITNCCANSHDSTKFAGEICADLLLSPSESQSQDHVLPNDPATPIALGDFFPSIQASVAALAKAAFPFLGGGQANGGFEYLGLDFILSYQQQQPQQQQPTPCAYLLEVNAPPSQDTATGLPHAEALHDSVLRDLMSLWVLPKLIPSAKEVPGGWQCVHTQPQQEHETNTALSIPSKAAIFNKMKWALFEKKALRQDAQRYAATVAEPTLSREQKLDSLALKAQSFFPFFQKNKGVVFLESAGGSQVPKQVIDRVTMSLEHRHRSVVGLESKRLAKEALLELTGASPSLFDVVLGSNASCLFSLLAQNVRIAPGDEIILSVENHLANVNPWIDLAERVGATIKWWDNTTTSSSVSSGNDVNCSSNLVDLVTPQTRVVAISHASNVLGQVRNLEESARIVREKSNGRAMVVVDGVATMPHIYCCDLNHVDVYVISCHKVFGPHLGALFCRKGSWDAASSLCALRSPISSLEVGTINYEACQGVVGSVEYLRDWYQSCKAPGIQERTGTIRDCYRLVREIEIPLSQQLIAGLERCPLVHILKSPRELPCNNATDWNHRLPVVTMYHERVPSSQIEKLCIRAGFLCRSGTFLSTNRFLQSYGTLPHQGFEDVGNGTMIRFSLTHYNTLEDIRSLLDFLLSIPGWI